MSFHWPYLLIALGPTLAGLLMAFRSSNRAREYLLSKFAAARLLPMLLASHSPALRRTKEALLVLGVLLVVFSFARPQWGYEWEEQRARGVDVVFVIDTSKSMLSQDVQPSRLERAKLAIVDCVEKMAGNRVGLVAFAGDAFLQCPLTLDYDAFRQTLEAVDSNTITHGGTDIASGLDEAAAALENSGNHKIIVLLTDGEDLEGEGVTEARKLAEDGVTVYTIGVGTPAGELIPFRNAQGQADFVRDQRGQIVSSHLDAKTLGEIAETTHGFYQPLGSTGEGLLKVYTDGIAKLTAENLKSQMHRQLIERFQWPLGIGTMILALEMLLGTRRPAWRRRPLNTINLADPLPTAPTKMVAPAATTAKAATALLLLALGLAGTPRSFAADIPATPDKPLAQEKPATTTTASAPAQAPGKSYSVKEAQSLFQKGDYPAAAEAFHQAAEASPRDGRFSYNEGASLYRSGNFDGAAQAFTKTLSSNDLALQQQAYYNLGNTHYRLGQAGAKENPPKAIAAWEQAVKDYQNALDLNGKDADAKYNLNLVKQQLEELKKQQEQQQDQQNQDKQQQDQQQDPSQQNQPPQNQNNSPQDKKDQQNSSPNQPQNGRGQEQKPDDQSGQKSSDQKNPSGQNPPDQQKPNQTSQPGAQDSPNQQKGNAGPSKPQNGSGGQNQPQPQKPSTTSNSPQKQPSGGTGNEQKPPNADQPGKNGEQKQPAPGDKKGSEPMPQKSGQQGTGGAGAGAQPAPGNPADANANGTVMIGVMTREEARQLLDSNKIIERKLPASQMQNPDPKPSSNDQFQKDW